MPKSNSESSGTESEIILGERKVQYGGLLVVGLILGILIGASFGGSFVGVANDEPNADQLVQDMAESVEDVKSYKMEVNQSIKGEIERDGNVRERSRWGEYEGHLNVVDKRAKNITASGQDNYWSGRGVGDPGDTVSTDIYLIEDTYYVKVSNSESSEWIVMDDPEFVENQKRMSNRVGRIASVVSNATPEYEGREEVNGTDTHRIKLELEEDADYFNQVVERGSVEEYSRQESNITLWLDTETNLPVKIDENAVVTRQRTDRGEVTNITLELDMTAEFSEYSDEAVEINLPQEAIEATE